MGTTSSSLQRTVRRIFRPPACELVIDRGMVHCPLTDRDIEWDACFSCPRVLSVQPDGCGGGQVTCRPQPQPQY